MHVLIISITQTGPLDHHIPDLQFQVSLQVEAIKYTVTFVNLGND